MDKLVIKLAMMLDQLRGHRTLLVVLPCLWAVTVRLLLLDAEHFIEALPNYSKVLLGSAALVAGSKMASGAREWMQAKRNRESNP